MLPAMIRTSPGAVFADRWFVILGTVMSVLVVSFVWLYAYPLSSDISMHLGVARAFLDLVSGQSGPDYPYALDLKVATYVAPQFILVAFLYLFDLVVAAKLALTLYVIAFFLGVAFLVRQINPSARYSLLIGLPLALGYFYHWGFWTSNVGMVLCIFAIGLSLKFEKRSGEGIVTGASRLVVVMAHPAPALALGCFDIIYLLVDARHNRNWYNPLRWQWRRMLMAWVPAAAFLVVSTLAVSTDGTARSTAMSFGSLKIQLLGIVRSFFLTSHWWEGAVPLLLAAIITVLLISRASRDRRVLGLIVAAVFVVLVGALIPRERFLGSSWEIGSRLVFIGSIVLFAAWSARESFLRPLIVSWLVVAFVINITASHYLWRRHESSFVHALNTLREEFYGADVYTRLVRTASEPSIVIGYHVTNWAWCHGWIRYADNGVIETNNFGPVRTIERPTASTPATRGLVLYHAYDRLEPGKGKAVFMAEDDIYQLILEPDQ